MKKKSILIMMAVTVIASSASVSNLMVYAEDFSDHESLTLNTETDEKSLFTDAVGQTEISVQSQEATPDYDVWLSDIIDFGLKIDGKTYGNALYKTFKEMQDPIYAELGGLLLEDVPLMSISSVWNNVIKREFYTNQKLIYETLLVDYIKHENKTNASSFDTMQIDRANAYLIKIFDELADMGVQDWAPDKFMSMSVEEAAKSFQNVQSMKKVVDDAKEFSENTQELIKLTSNVLALKDKKDAKVQLIKNAREACASMQKPNKDFIAACNEIIEATESTDIDFNYVKTQSASIVMDKVIDKVWDKLCDKNLVLKSIDWSADTMDILFNTSNAASDNLKLSILYTMDCYFKMGLSNASEQYLKSRTDSTAAQTFNSCFEGYVNFQIYGNDTAKSWISSVHNDGVLNRAFTYIFCREALKNASELKNLCDSQNKTRNQILNILEKYQTIYSNKYMKDEYKQAMSVPVTPTPVMDPKDYKISEGITSPNPEKASGKCGDSAYWKLFQDGTLVIYGSGETYADDFGSYEVKKVEITEGITKIGEGLFAYCGSLEKINIPNSVKEIGERAFNECSKLTEVTGGNNLERIGYEAFFDCEELKNITLSCSIKRADCIFVGCENLKTVGPASGNYNIKLKFTESLPDELLSNSRITEVVLPDSLKDLGSRAFESCGALKKIHLSSSITDIPENTFAYCGSLEKINIPNSVKEIGERAFSGCSKLTEVTGGNNLERIGYEAFFDCEELKNITLSCSIKRADCIFVGCENLKTVGPASGNYNIKLKFTESLPDELLSNSRITEVVLPDSLKDLGSRAFESCGALKKIHLSSSITDIPENTFAYCGSLEKINIPNSVKEIGERAFNECLKLTEVTGGNNLEKIGYEAFENCEKLKKIYLLSNLQEINGDVFYGCNNVVIYGYKNSYAETYAKKNNISFVSLGEAEIKPVITVNSGILVAKLNTTDKIIEHGIVYGKGTNVTLNTPGRTRVAYSRFDSNKSYSFDTANLTGCTIRAYVIYTDKNGNAQTVYSNAYSK